MLFDWDPDKNQWLKRERQISFEEIATLLGAGVLWKVIDHPNVHDYPNQRVFLLPINNYIYLVPFVIDKDKGAIFLKTAFPNRKATKLYLKEGGHEA